MVARALPLAIAHPAAAFRRGVASVTDGTRLRYEEPEDLAGWLELPGARVLVVPDAFPAWEEAWSRALDHPDVVLVVLVGELDPAGYRQALAAGAAGVVHVDASPELISHVVTAAVDGEVVLPAEIARRLAGRPGPPPALSADELAMLTDLSEGATVVDLAERYFLAERSVRRRLQNVYMKLGVANRAQAMTRAAQLGLFD